MPALHTRHRASTEVQQELRAIWEAVDLLRKRESSTRNTLAEMGEEMAGGGTAGTGSEIFGEFHVTLFADATPTAIA